MSSTDLSLAESALQARIRDKLNQENIKLWTEPFYIESTKTVVDSEVMALASRYAMEFLLVEADVVECLFTLQRNSIQKALERDHFNATGLATIRMKFSGNTKVEGAERIQVNLKDMTGKELKARIAELAAVQENRLKLICSGRVITDASGLAAQGVKNGSQIMVLTVSGNQDQEAFQQSEDQFRQLEETRGAADYLAGRNNTDNFGLEVADQHGKPLTLPDAERKVLAVALALHEKGRKCLKAAEFSKALVFLLEADAEYSKCNSSILDMVDNFGLLNLDIAWCYLSLQSINELPAIEARLTRCQKALERSYGENMERVIALQGSSGWEAALFVRLHLLQAISAYHLGKVDKAKSFFMKVEQELQRLTIGDEQLADLINMGYGPNESRLALRACFGNLQAAVDWIIRRREEKKENARLEAEEALRRKFQKRLGFCDNGQAVNVTVWRNLKEMGYDAGLARAALKRANNDLNEAIQLAGDSAFVSSFIAELPNKSSAAAAPTAGAGSEPMPIDPQAVADAVAAAAAAGPSTSSSSTADLAAQAQEFYSLPAESISEEQMLREQAEAEKSQKAYDALAADICSEAEYIDLTLSAETKYLAQYKELLRF